MGETTLCIYANGAECKGMKSITSQEYRVLLLLAEGYKREAIARRLEVSARTVRRCTVSLRAKLEAVNDAHLVTVAYRRRWIA